MHSSVQYFEGANVFQKHVGSWLCPLFYLFENLTLLPIWYALTSGLSELPEGQDPSTSIIGKLIKKANACVCPRPTESETLGLYWRGTVHHTGKGLGRANLCWNGSFRMMGKEGLSAPFSEITPKVKKGNPRDSIAAPSYGSFMFIPESSFIWESLQCSVSNCFSILFSGNFVHWGPL